MKIINESIGRDNLDLMWEFLENEYIATDDEIKLVVYINGYNHDSLYDILYVRTGFRSLEQIVNDRELEYESWMEELDNYHREFTKNNY